jgi:hypothetical protein
LADKSAGAFFGKGGKSAVVQAAKAIPGNNSDASAASFIRDPVSGFLFSLPGRAGELIPGAFARRMKRVSDSVKK